MAFLAIDCGTSSCRAVSISSEGTLLSASREPVTVAHPRPRFAEVDPAGIWETVCRVVRSEAAKYPRHRYDALGVSAMLGYVFLGPDQEPLIPAMIWMDNRATTETDRILSLVSPHQLYAKTGRRPSPELLAPKLLWLKTNRPEIAARMSRVIGLKDDIVRRFTGVVQTDLAHLNYTLVHNIEENRLDPDLLAAFELDASLFPAPHLASDRIGMLTPSAATATGLTAGLPVVSGSSDGTSAMYGAGVLEPDRAALVSGTTDVLMMSSDRWISDSSRSLTVNNAMVAGKFLVGGAMGLSGGTIGWLQSVLKQDIRELEPAIEDLPPGSEGLLFVPGLTGERAPFWMEQLSGALIGLQPNHGPHHLYRAALEGTTYRLIRLLRILNREQLRPKSLNLVGGWANLPVWNRIRADATGLDSVRLDVTEATCLGTALFCRVGLDPTGSLEQGARQWLGEAERFSPDPAAHRTYQQLEQLYSRYLEQNESLHESLSKFVSSRYPAQ